MFRAEQAERPIYSGRPAGRRGPPVTIYHEAFAKLKDALEDSQRTVNRVGKEQVDDMAKLFIASTNIYETESERCKAVIPLLVKLLDITLAEKPKLAKDFEPDAIATLKKEAVICYIEVKNEFGIGGDCGVQNALGLVQYKEIRNASCCPCITVSVAGPYISIGSAILADVFTELIILRARLFATVVEALRNLGGLKPKESDIYRRSLFRATYRNEGVIVKFCEQYHGNAHNLVAEASHAPELFFCERIQGGVTMVIMGFIAGQDAYYRFKKVDLPSAILDDVKSAVRVLHDAGFVFGDLRRPNIIIDTTGARDQALLINFEWVGQDSQTRYLANLNNSGEIEWAKGMEPHGIMRKGHDIEMIDKLRVYQRRVLRLSTSET
ncbi:hypothetical protein H4582DRAFT_2112768 [Lactarius indigo]|nr:hypothetical protein H4582DRAFT_2112768 [Lactarius indigo]